MGLLVVGSIALDDIETPFDQIKNALGGSSTYIALAASYFTKPIHLVGVVGDDFSKRHIEMFKKYDIDLEGLQIIKGEKTFRWSGRYHYDLNVRDTISTKLNVFQNFDPIIPEKSRKDRFVLLGNIDPVLQLNVLKQLITPKFTICDTMNFWIERKRNDLLKVMEKLDVFIINDSEARLLSDEPNLIKSAKIILEMGPKYLVIKKGENGAILFSDNVVFCAPAYPLEDVRDPTGAGDSFAGGFGGYLHKTQDLSLENLKRAVIYGSTMASLCVEKFGTKGIENLSSSQIYARFLEFKELSRFEDNTSGLKT